MLVDLMVVVWGCMEFSGTPREVFWEGYIEPFLEVFTIDIIQQVEKECSENKLNLKDEIKYLSIALLKMYDEIYKKMVDVDQNLRGKGYPKQITQKNVSVYLSRMENFLEDQISMLLKKHTIYKRVRNYILNVGNEVCSKVIVGGILTLIGIIYCYMSPYLSQLILHIKNFFIS